MGYVRLHDTRGREGGGQVQAYLQSWAQKELSTVAWRVEPTRKWDAATNVFESDARWQADVYVFALFAQWKKKKVDPLNVTRWRFFVVPVWKLHDKLKTRTITHAAMEGLAGRSIGYADLAAAVKTQSRRDMMFPCQP